MQNIIIGLFIVITTINGSDRNEYLMTITRSEMINTQIVDTGKINVTTSALKFEKNDIRGIIHIGENNIDMNTCIGSSKKYIDFMLQTMAAISSIRDPRSLAEYGIFDNKRLKDDCSLIESYYRLIHNHSSIRDEREDLISTIEHITIGSKRLVLNEHHKEKQLGIDKSTTSSNTSLKVSSGNWDKITRDADINGFKSHATRFIWGLSGRLEEVRYGEIKRDMDKASDYIIDRILVAEYRNNHDLLMAELESPGEGKDITGEQGGPFFDYAIYLYKKYLRNNWYDFTPTQRQIAKTNSDKTMSKITNEFMAMRDAMRAYRLQQK